MAYGLLSSTKSRLVGLSHVKFSVFMETVKSFSKCKLADNIKSRQLIPFHHVDGSAFGFAQPTNQCVEISAD